MFKKILAWILNHKVYSLIGVVILIFGGNFLYKSVRGNTSTINYVLGSVTKGTLITSVSGSGQISVTNQVDIKAKSSGEVTSVNVTAGREVKAGAILASIDARDAVRSVRDAQTSLQTAKLELDQLMAPVEELTVFQAQTALVQSKEAKQKSEDDLKKAYEDGFSDISNAFLELPGVMTGLQDLLFANSFNSSQSNIDFYAGAVKSYDGRVMQYRDDAANSYYKARTAYDKNFADYKLLNRASSNDTVQNMVLETYDTAKLISEAVKDANNLIQFYQDRLTEHNLSINSISTSHLSKLNAYTGTTNSHLSTLLAIQHTITDSQKSIVSADRTIKEKELSLAKTISAPADLDIRAKKIAIQQKQDALIAAQQALADHYVRAPFAGVIAKVSVKKGDSISSGSAVVTIITKQNTAEISLNEVDAAKIKVDQKVNLTFDAIDGLSLSGKVAEIDTLGTVTQGVVTYNVKIILDTQDDRIKLGMSVSSVIITDVKQDVLIVPSGAVKTQGSNAYVEMLLENFDNPSAQGVMSANPPRQQMVTVGLSNDTQTEIISGLKEGDQIITRTVTASATKPASAQAPSLFGTGGGTGGVRIPR
jgi:RND family efflux transporter MFP subunit